VVALRARSALRFARYSRGDHEHAVRRFRAPGSASTAPRLIPPPASLRDAKVDGELIVDASDDFVPTPRASALFALFPIDDRL
jgi:hypothetical protein